MDINPPTLPNAEAAVVPAEKIRDYLLDLGHPVGGDKARFFIHFGFQRARWEELADALRRHAQENPVVTITKDASRNNCHIVSYFARVEEWKSI